MGSGSVGTTTTGADISSVFPLQDWITTLSRNIEHPFEGAPTDNLPMFIIDSEGMGVRGDLYDFITTAPPAIIAKVKHFIGKVRAKYLLESNRLTTWWFKEWHLCKII